MHAKATAISMKDVLITVPDTVLFHEVGEEAVLLDVQSGAYYGLNQIGARIWVLVQEGYSVSALRGTLLDEYEVSPDVLEQDIQKFFKLLCSKGIIEIHECPAS